MPPDLKQNCSHRRFHPLQRVLSEGDSGRLRIGLTTAIEVASCNWQIPQNGNTKRRFISGRISLITQRPSLRTRGLICSCTKVLTRDPGISSSEHQHQIKNVRLGAAPLEARQEAHARLRLTIEICLQQEKGSDLETSSEHCQEMKG